VRPTAIVDAAARPLPRPLSCQRARGEKHDAPPDMAAIASRLHRLGVVDGDFRFQCRDQPLPFGLCPGVDAFEFGVEFADRELALHEPQIGGVRFPDAVRDRVREPRQRGEIPEVGRAAGLAQDQDPVDEACLLVGQPTVRSQQCVAVGAPGGLDLDLAVVAFEPGVGRCRRPALRQSFDGRREAFAIVEVLLARPGGGCRADRCRRRGGGGLRCEILAVRPSSRRRPPARRAVRRAGSVSTNMADSREWPVRRERIGSTASASGLRASPPTVRTSTGRSGVQLLPSTARLRDATHAVPTRRSRGASGTRRRADTGPARSTVPSRPHHEQSSALSAMRFRTHVRRRIDVRLPRVRARMVA
jgi:hypothetical protein